MNVVTRILSKVIGQEITKEELEVVSGGQIDRCMSILGGYYTIQEQGGQPICDFG